MTRILQPFEFFAPSNLEEALEILRTYGRDVTILAGGTDVLSRMKIGALQPKSIMSIQEIPDLDFLEYNEKDGLRLGPMTKIRTVEDFPGVREKYTSLYEAARVNGTPQIRNMGTVVGNICRSSPSADCACALLSLDAQICVRSAKGVRWIAIDKFFTAYNETAIKPDEMVTEVRILPVEDSTGTAFIKIGRLSQDLAKINSAAQITLRNGNGVCKKARISLGAMAPTSMRAKEAEKLIEGKEVTSDLLYQAGQKASEETQPITDLRSTAEYRKRVSAVLSHRVLKLAWERTKN